MGIVRRNITRSILNSTEITKATSIPSATTNALVLTTSDSLYIGYKGRFAHRYFSMGVANTNAATLSVAYWDGSAWTAVEDLVDQTDGLTQDGFISWQNKTDFNFQKLAPVSNRDLYWIRIQTDTEFSAGTTIQYVDNLFCDDELLRRHYPELVSDSRWLPTGRTDFLEQYAEATDLVLLRLKQDGLIREESQVIDPNEVAIAAAHAAAYIIVHGVAREESEFLWAKDIEDSMNNELNRVKLDIDLDESGIIEKDERNEGNIFVPRGGH